MPKILAIHPGTPGLATHEADEVFEQIAQFASYGFNKSHAAAYAAIGFSTAYLKTHHPEAYFPALMNVAIGEIKDIAVCVGELKARNIPLLAPNINLCGARFRPIQGHARLGIAYALAALRGVGMNAAMAIVEEREAGGRYTSFADFKSRVGAQVGKKAMVALVQAGAFDGIVASRADGVALAEERAQIAHTAQISFFDAVPDMDTRTTLPEWSREELLDREFNSLGFWLSGHPLEGFRRQGGAKPLTFVGALRDREHTPRQADIVASVVDFKTKGTKSGGVMAVLTLSDPHETFEAIAFDDDWVAIREHVRKKATLTLSVSPTTEQGSNDLRLIVNGATPFKARAQKAA